MADRLHPDYSTLMSDMPDLEKVQAAKDVAATIDTPGWGVILDLLEARKADELLSLVRHKPVRSEAEYASRLAEVRGMAAVLDACQAVLHVGRRAERELNEVKGAS